MPDSSRPPDRDSSPKPDQPSFTAMARRTALIYALLAGAWIFFSDRLLLSWVHDPLLLADLSVTKGYFFVAVTALLSDGAADLRGVEGAVAPA